MNARDERPRQNVKSLRDEKDTMKLKDMRMTKEVKRRNVNLKSLREMRRDVTLT